MKAMTGVPIGAGLIALLMCASGEAAPVESAEMAKVRQKAKHRTRRIIYNNDGCDALTAGASTIEGFLSKRMNAAIGTQVDSVFYCTGATTMFTHRAEVGETLGRQVTDSSSAMARHGRDNLTALRELGHDPLDLAVKVCHKNGLEVFFTHRINDIHDTFLDWELSTWKREHPEYLMGKREDMKKYNGNDPRHWWSALDFERPEVLDYLIAIISDVCRRYDIDGIEIDYFRSPMFFRPNLAYQPATPAQLSILSGFQRRVREVAYQEGNRRGRPILVATRVPMTVGKCRHVGIDIKAWLAENLLDVLTTGGGYVPFTMPTRELVVLGHDHDVPVYPTISASGMKDRFRSIKAWRGAAANAWHNGADGVYLFNTFPTTPGHPHFTQLGDPEALRCADKVFAIDNRKVTEGDLAQAIKQDQILPVELPAKGEARLVLPIGDDIAAAAEQGLLEDASLHVCCSPLGDADRVSVRINDRDARPQDNEALSCAVPGKIGNALRFDGANVLSAGTGRSLQITEEDFSLSLWIKTRQRESWSGFVVFVEPSQDPGVKLYWNAGVLHISLRRKGWNDWDLPGGDTVLDGNWHHYAATFDRDDVAKVYLDGQLVSERSIKDKAGSLGTKKVMLIGTGDKPYEGLMDDLRLYRRVLTEAEIRQIVNRPGKDGPVGKEMLIGWWKFDETVGMTFTDSSGNDNHARPRIEAGGTWRIYRPDPNTLRQGDNVLALRGSRRDTPTIVRSVELHVDYR